MVTLSNGNTTVIASEETAPTWLAMGYKPVKPVAHRRTKKAETDTDKEFE